MFWPFHISIFAADPDHERALLGSILRSDLASNFPALSSGKSNIEQHDVGAKSGQLRQSLPTRVHAAHLMPPRRRHVSLDLADINVAM